MKKIISILLIILTISFMSSFVYAGEQQADKQDDQKDTTSSLTDVTSLIGSMNGTNLMSSVTGNNIGNTINMVIGLLQIAGTGISITVVSLLGIKYILASPSEKADTKKSILPVVIGCIMVFGAVNIISAVYDFTNKIQGAGEQTE